MTTRVCQYKTQMWNYVELREMMTGCVCAGGMWGWEAAETSESPRRASDQKVNQFFIIEQLCIMFLALCSLLFALCSLLFALCSWILVPLVSPCLRWTLETAVQRAGLFLLFIFFLIVLGFVASGSFRGNFFSINALWSGTRLMQPYYSVHYGALPPIWSQHSSYKHLISIVLVCALW